MARPTPTDNHLAAIINQLHTTLTATPHNLDLSAAGRCPCLACRTERLAARGWPTSTTGDQTGIRTHTNTSPVETTATTHDPYGRLSDNLALHLARLRAEALAVLAIAAVIDSHADDNDPIPAGRGHCQACETFCIGDGSNDRLRSGLCHACATALTRWRPAHQHAARSDFIRHRRQALGMPEAMGA